MPVIDLLLNFDTQSLAVVVYKKVLPQALLSVEMKDATSRTTNTPHLRVSEGQSEDLLRMLKKIGNVLCISTAQLSFKVFCSGQKQITMSNFFHFVTVCILKILRHGLHLGQIIYLYG